MICINLNSQPPGAAIGPYLIGELLVGAEIGRLLWRSFSTIDLPELDSPIEVKFVESDLLGQFKGMDLKRR